MKVLQGTPGSAAHGVAAAPAGPRARERLALLVTAFLFPSAGATLTLPWLLGLRIWRQVAARRIRWVRSVLDLPLAAFLLLALVAGLRSSMPTLAVGSWVLAVLAFAVVLQAGLDGVREDPALLRSLYKAFGLGTLCASVYGLAVFYVRHADRAQLLTLGPNALGFGLMVGIFLSAPLLEESPPWPMLATLTIAVSLVCVTATFSREALYGLAAGGITYLWMARRRLPLRFLSVILLSMGFGLLGVLATPSILNPLAQQLRNQHVADVRPKGPGTLLIEKTIEFVVSRAGNSDRLPVWEADVRAIHDRPWFGVGLGVFPFVVQRWASQQPQGTPPHSIYLGMAAEVGVPGAVAFVAMPVVAIWWAARRGGADRHAALAAMVGMLAGEVRDTVLIGLHMALGFVVVLAMLVAPAPREGAPP